MYVILGATGNTGSVVARKLLDKGKRVRVVGRDNKKLASFVTRGADAFTADVLDTDALSRAFAGAQGVASARGILHGEYSGADRHHPEFRHYGGASSRRPSGADDRNARHRRCGRRSPGAAGLPRAADAGTAGDAGRDVHGSGKDHRHGDWETGPHLHTIAR